MTVKRIMKSLVMMLTLMMCLAEAVPAMAKTTTTSVTKKYAFSEKGVIKTLSYKMPANGYVYFTINPTESAGKNAVYGSLHYEISANGVVYESSKVLKSDGKKTTVKYAFKKDTVIKLKMTSAYYLNDYVSKATVKIYNAVPDRFEAEPNNSKSKATSLKADTYTVGLTTLKEDDWFVFTAPKAGKYKVWGNAYENSNHSVAYEVYRGSDGKRLSSSALQANGELKDMSNGYVSLAKGAKLYIKVKGLTTAKGFHNLYRVKVKAK